MTVLFVAHMIKTWATVSLSKECQAHIQADSQFVPVFGCNLCNVNISFRKVPVTITQKMTAD